MAGAALHTPFQGLLWSQYLVQSDAARMLGVAEFIPAWVAPPLESSALVERSFFHRDWLIPILLLIGTQIITRIDQFGLGYALYRITSDVEKLPFPMAPVAALGTMALAESTEEREKSWKWRVFSIGGMLGLLFGAVYVLLPALSSLVLVEPIRLIPIPWIELTLHTEDWLPAVATGIQLDLGLVFIGMVLPFWAVMGGLGGLIITIVANPLLYQHGILNRWHPGMRTVETVFANNFDFYLSFGIGLGLAIGLIGIWHVIRSFGRRGPGARGNLRDLFRPPPGRGDINFWLSIGIYVFSTASYVLLCVWLVPNFPVVFFIVYGFLYTPIISYITARMEGIAGQFVSLPLVREASFIAGAKYFGYQGIEIWYAPIPIHNYGSATVSFREIELTGTSIRGIIKSEIVVFPVVMIASLLFSQFIWRLAPIPSNAYPFAQELWHLQALNSLLMQTSTLEGNSLFFQALNWIYVGSGTLLGVVIYLVLTLFGLPVMLVYGLVRGLGQSTPHGLILEVIGALLGRFFFLRRYGAMWRQYAPVLLAGFSCGMGLMGMFAMGLNGRSAVSDRLQFLLLRLIISSFGSTISPPGCRWFPCEYAF
ncbi:MAG: OPT/YSL family transporter [Desulfobacterales bacterium]|nr:OPT/YSL family transporter [Desulfobacterales bacterium]